MTNKEILHRLLKGMDPYLSCGVPEPLWTLALDLTEEVYDTPGKIILIAYHNSNSDDEGEKLYTIHGWTDDGQTEILPEDVIRLMEKPTTKPDLKAGEQTTVTGKPGKWTVIETPTSRGDNYYTLEQVQHDSKNCLKTEWIECTMIDGTLYNHQASNNMKKAKIVKHYRQVNAPASFLMMTTTTEQVYHQVFEGTLAEAEIILEAFVRVGYEDCTENDYS